MDWQFKCIRKTIQLKGIDKNITKWDEHVPKVEWYIRMVKERARATINTLPSKYCPANKIMEIVYNTVFWLNCFPQKDGIRPTLSPNYNNYDISIENESPEDSCITINYLNKVEQMNTAQINVDPEIGDELHVPITVPTNHRYNLRPWTTVRNENTRWNRPDKN